MFWKNTVGFIENIIASGIDFEGKQQYLNIKKGCLKLFLFLIIVRTTTDHIYAYIALSAKDWEFLSQLGLNLFLTVIFYFHSAIYIWMLLFIRLYTSAFQVLALEMGCNNKLL